VKLFGYNSETNWKRNTIKAKHTLRRRQCRSEEEEEEREASREETSFDTGERKCPQSRKYSPQRGGCEDQEGEGIGRCREKEEGGEKKLFLKVNTDDTALKTFAHSNEVEGVYIQEITKVITEDIYGKHKFLPIKPSDADASGKVAGTFVNVDFNKSGKPTARTITWIVSGVTK